jgi:hypothetical protein
VPYSLQGTENVNSPVLAIAFNGEPSALDKGLTASQKPLKREQCFIQITMLRSQGEILIAASSRVSKPSLIGPILMACYSNEDIADLCSILPVYLHFRS